MHNDLSQRSNKAVATWLLVGVGMIVVQILIGGITRLTESGLSITEWKPITGALPPLNHADWLTEFEKYRTTDQFKYVHQDFTLRNFKFIFFWEWFHRVWARLMALVFLIGFVYFLVRRKFNSRMVLPMVILFILGAMQGAIGWLMVKSGLVPEKYFVGHVELTTHLIAAIILLSYTLWFALSMLPATQKKFYHSRIHNMLLVLVVLVFFQLIYGGFMAGLKAGATAPTWPTINGKFVPEGMQMLSPVTSNFTDNKITIHFIHRGLAYLIFFFVTGFYFIVRNTITDRQVRQFTSCLLAIVMLQVLLGILTVVNATDRNLLVWFGVAHQFTAMMLVLNLVVLLNIVRHERSITARLG